MTPAVETLPPMPPAAALRTIDMKHASLPHSYSRAREALTECVSMDECKNWADKAAALASYAKQANDNDLGKMATRIRARAIRRCGQLLKQVKPARNQHDAKISGTRKGAARKAGLSARQAKQAMRVASVAEPDFEAQVEGSNPPSVKKLAHQGTKTRAKNVTHLDAKRLVRAVDRFHSDLTAIDLGRAAEGLSRKEATAVRKHLHAIGGQIRRIEKLTRKGRVAHKPMAEAA